MKSLLRMLYSMLLFGAGALHFIKEKEFRKIVPEVLPFRKSIVIVTGVLEILFSILLWIKRGQHITGKLLALFMIAVFPANVYMAVNKISFKSGTKANSWILWLRLPVQVPLIIGALTLGKKH